jgi:hypothetical protein
LQKQQDWKKLTYHVSMKTKITSLVVAFFCLLPLLTSKGFNPVPAPAGTTAYSAVDFLNTIGVNAAISTRGENLAKTIEAIKYTGIRWIRTGYESNIPVNDLVHLHQQTGVLFSYGLLSGGTDFARLLNGARQLAAASALLAVEGLNEPNNWGIKYLGQPGGSKSTWIPVAQLQKDLYGAVKKDPVLKKYPVWSLSENGGETDNVGLQFLEIPKGAGTLMPDGTKYADFANCHNYLIHPSHPGLYDNQTWNAADPGSTCKVDGLFGNYGSTWLAHYPGYSEKSLSTLPRVTTETGAKIEGELSEEKQGCLFLNLYLAQFKRGWSYTAVYLLKDRTDEAGNQQYGFYKPDYTPRKSAIYLHNLTTILADNGPVRNPGKLHYSIPDKPQTVHDLLLQKRSGIFELLVWGEKVKGAEVVKVNFNRTYAKVNIYDPTIGTSAGQTLEKVSSLSLTLSDHPLVIEVITKP